MAKCVGEGVIMLKIATFNVNSIRTRLEKVLAWLEAESPDILCLQETKVHDDKFPAAGFVDLGYEIVFKGQKTYNGVAIASKHPLANVHYGLADWADPGEARLIAADVKGISVVNTYVPHGQHPDSAKFSYKLAWIKGLRSFFDHHYSPGQPLVWAGDFNVAPEPIDIYDPARLFGRVGYHPAEHNTLAYVKEWGFSDVFRAHVKEGGNYTFWDYRIPNAVPRKLGWRIDHIWATPPLAAVSRRAWVDIGPRLQEKPSDHTYVVAEFDWPG